MSKDRGADVVRFLESIFFKDVKSYGVVKKTKKPKAATKSRKPKNKI